MKDIIPYQQQIQNCYQDLLNQHDLMIPTDERLKIDLHCHDENSNVPDELWGRILRVPETWTKTSELQQSLRFNQCNAITITNHNNARSCWELLDKGVDVLVGAEFSCHFQEYDINLHVLTYGFTPEQEVKLNKYRRNLYQFLTYTAEHDLPTVLPHPLFFSSRKPYPGMDLFEKLALLFKRFEVVNGQRDIRQNLLIWEWLENLTEEKIWDWSKKHQLDPENFCRIPYEKMYTGGSDDHMGMFAGTCGSYLHVPELAKRLEREKPSEIALDSLRNGLVVPFGHVGNDQKLNAALLDYLCQMILNMNEPGLLRLFLHHGTLKDKLFCLGASNIIQELKRHKFTVYFFKTLHESLNGKRPGLLARFRVSSDFKPVLVTIDRIALTKRGDQTTYQKTLGEAIPSIFRTLNQVVAGRIKNHIEETRSLDGNFELDTHTLIKRFEIPSHYRSLFNDEINKTNDHVSQVNVPRFLDKLSFPVLASAIIAGITLISTRSLNANRSFINQFADDLGRHKHPNKALWLTDTLNDKNGVSVSLGAKLKVIQENNLPIDFLVCSHDIDKQAHLKVVRPVGQFSFPNYKEQAINVPDILEIKQLFLEGGYDRIICSTEVVMGLVALFLKESFKVPAYFFLHTDWLEFVKDTAQLEPSGIDRIRRILRMFYCSFDGVFVLNKDHRNWLTGIEIQMPKEKAFLTAHWVSEQFHPCCRQTGTFFGEKIQEQDFVLLYAGRLSEEKGVLELATIFQRLKETQPGAKLVIAGVGPAEKKLRTALPEAVFLGWVEKQQMPILYSSSSLLVLPSRFDTFGNVVLEAMSCGLPVAAYRIKGPKDIIENSKNGILANDLTELAEKIATIAGKPMLMNSIRVHALKRAQSFTKEKIMKQFLGDLNLQGDLHISRSESRQKNITTGRPSETDKLKQAG
ncbi:glycosyltransferase [bacterium]|nr:glycosyltransferase [bacterium]